MIEYFLVPAILLGVVASIEDYRRGIVKNQLILMLLALGIAFQVLTGTDLFLLVGVTLGALALSFLFWLVGIWPAGDAKLFWAYFFFFPPNLLGSPSVVIDFLVNVFVPIFFFMFFIIILKSKLSIVREALEYSFNPYRLFMLFIMFVGFVWLVMLPTRLFKIGGNFFFSLVILFIAFEFLRRFWTFRTELAFLLCAGARIVLFPREFYSFSYAIQIIEIIGVFAFFRFFTLYLAFWVFTDRVRIGKLRVGMEPAEGIFRAGKGFRKEPFLHASFIDFFSQKTKKCIHDQNELSRDDIEKIKRLRKEGKIEFDSLLVHQKQPFALFIFIGFLLTLFFSGSFVLFLRGLF